MIISDLTFEKFDLINSKLLKLIDVIIYAKNKNQSAILFLINKYNPLILKYSSSYHLKNYDKEDLIQIGNISIINAINKYDLTKGEDFIDAYIINSIKNAYRNLARGQIKYQSESSLNITIDENSDIESLLSSDFDLEGYVINDMEKDLLISILKSLSESEYELIKAAYFTPNCTLYKYCKENNLNYPKKRRELIALLPKLRKLIEN
ncbi:sigma-70 family RNA polymerase sigma factor [Clostridioides difficile]